MGRDKEGARLASLWQRVFIEVQPQHCQFYHENSCDGPIRHSSISCLLFRVHNPKWRKHALTFCISYYLEISAVFCLSSSVWQLSKLSAKCTLLDTACMMSATLNVSNFNELQNPFKKGFKFIVFSCQHCHTWKGRRGTGI